MDDPDHSRGGDAKLVEEQRRELRKDDNSVAEPSSLDSAPRTISRCNMCISNILRAISGAPAAERIDYWTVVGLIVCLL